MLCCQDDESSRDRGWGGRGQGTGRGRETEARERERQRDRLARPWTLFNLVSLNGSAPTPVLRADALPCPRALIWQHRGPLRLHEQATGVLFDAPVLSKCKAQQLFTTADLLNFSTTSVVLNFSTTSLFFSVHLR